MKKRDIVEERIQVGKRLRKIIWKLQRAAVLGDYDTPEARRAQTLKIKVASRELARLHIGILNGFARGGSSALDKPNRRDIEREERHEANKWK